MSSGLYSAVSGARVKMQALEALSNNISNASTPGFKKDRVDFASVLNSATAANANGINFTRLAGDFIDFTQGTPEHTGGTFDLALNSKGLFKVQGKNGFLYTRLGSFRRDKNGTLVDHSGNRVMDERNRPIVIPKGETEIEQDGSILVNGAEAGKIGIFTVDDQSLLQKLGGSQFTLPAGVGDKVYGNAQVLQGSLESSNVNIMQDMAKMMDDLRTFESYQKVVKTYGTLAEKDNQLGSLG